MFGKFHKYNSRNKEYIQTSGIDDIITTNNIIILDGFSLKNIFIIFAL
jgi:hypothetical protein